MEPHGSDSNIMAGLNRDQLSALCQNFLKGRAITSLIGCDRSQRPRCVDFLCPLVPRAHPSYDLKMAKLPAFTSVHKQAPNLGGVITSYMHEKRVVELL